MFIGHTRFNNGFTLIETLVGISILVLVSLSVFSLFNTVLRVLWENKARVGAQVLANEYVELAHNLPYSDVGTIGGVPAGVLQQTQMITRNDIAYTITTSVVYIDDPFDGVLGGVPDDTLPADYKRVRVAVSWNYRLSARPVLYVTDVVPNGLESNTGGGTIRISVIDAGGLPVDGADVHILNTDVSPAIDVHLASNSNGEVVLPGAPESIETYDITVTKSGYSTDRTYEVDPVNLPSPSKPPLTVLQNQVTNSSFAIDVLSTVTLRTVLASDGCSVAQLDAPRYAALGASNENSTDMSSIDDQGVVTKEGLFRIAVQDQIYVDGVGGSDTTGDGSSANPYATLTRALQDINQGEGDVIHLAGGQTYTESPFVLDSSYSGTTSTPTTIRSWSGTATATIATLGSRVFTLSGAKHILFDHIAFSGATDDVLYFDGDTIDISLQDSYISGSGGDGLHDNGTGGLHTILRSTFENNTGNGIYLLTQGSTVSDSIVRSNLGYGIQVSHSTGSNTLTGNTVYGNSSDGVRADGLGSITIQNTTSYSQTAGSGFTITNGAGVLSSNTSFGNSSHGFDVSGASSALSGNQSYTNGGNGIYARAATITLSGNTLYGNTQDGARLENCVGCSVTNNIVYSNTVDGIRVVTSNNTTLSDNQVYSNVVNGIETSGSTAFVLERNTVRDNTNDGIAVSGSSGSVLRHNLVYGNTNDGLILNSNSMTNTVEYNTVADNGSDGIVADGVSPGNNILHNIIAFNGVWGLVDLDNLSEPTDTYNLFYDNTSGDMQNLTPMNGGTGTITGQDPLFVSRASANYHLQSVKGYYPFGLGDTSSAYSSAIDVGDSSSSYSTEPTPNGCIVNIGRYGNTTEASKSREGGDPLALSAFTLRGSKTIGTDGSGFPVYKYEQTHQTDSSGEKTLIDVEWDSYTITLGTGTGYDIAYIDPPELFSILPNSTQTVTIGLLSDANDTLRVIVRDDLGLPLSGADVRVRNVGLSYDKTVSTASHGQSFFTPLSAVTYTIDVTRGGYDPYSGTVDVSGDTVEAIIMTPQ